MAQSNDKNDPLRQLGIIHDDVPEDCDLPPAVIAEFKEAFNAVDTDEDGLINASELMSAMQALSAKVTATQAEEMIRELDLMGKGAIQMPQFIILMERHSHNSGAEQELIDAFKVFDTRGNGRLKASELRHILTSLGEKLSEEEVEELIREVDVDGDGEVLCNEFASIMLARG